VAYYDEHAAEFIANTLSVDVSELYEPFLSLIPPVAESSMPGADPAGIRWHS
jgi:hypothetical protein